MANHNTFNFNNENNDSDDDEPISRPIPRPPLSELLGGTPEPPKPSIAEQLFAAEQLDSDEDDDDDTEESPSPKKRRRKAGRMLRGLFKRRRQTVEEPVVEASEYTPPTDQETPRLFKLPELPINESATEPEQPSTVESANDDDQTPLNPQTTSQTRPTPPPRPTTTQPPQPPNIPPRPPVIPRAVPVPAPPIFNQAPPTGGGNVLASTLVAPAAANIQPTPLANHVEQNPNRTGNAALALVGLEFLARRRQDKKIRRNADRQQKQINQLKKDRETPAPVVERIVTAQPQERPAPQPRPTTEVLERPSNVTELVAAVPVAAAINERQPDAPKVLEKPTPTPESRVIHPQAQQERQPLKDQLEQLRPEKPQPQERNIPQRNEQQPTQPRANVEQAPRPKQPEASTEAPTPVRERDFERRHEVKDPQLPQVSASATQASAAQSQAAVPSNGIIPGTIPTAIQPSSKKATKTQQDLYKQSMQVGFMVGLATIVLGLIAFILLRS